MVLSIGMMGTSAVAQTGGGISATLRGLRSTARQLGQIGRPASSAGASPASSQAVDGETDPGDPFASDGTKGRDQTEALGEFRDQARASAPSGVSDRQPSKNRPGSFEVAGVRLGMSPHDVEGVARSHKARFYDPSFVTSYQSDVAARSARARGAAEPRQRRAIAFTRMRLDQGSVAEVGFAQTPQGPRVNRIDYRMSWTGYTRQSLSAALTGRYGVPRDAALNPLHVRWISPGDSASNPQQPALVVMEDGERIIFRIEEGTAAARARDAVLRHHVEADAAKGHPSSF
ncbi:hypothetical protein IFT82_04595 [Sphingomonas sp. CFBP 8760]|nr:hypothetical protein [Sphingomonas sp. CFBP 8760]